MQNKPNFRKSQMNVNKVLTEDYENETLGERGKNKPNSNPISKQLQNPIYPGHLLINRMNRICCVFGLTVQFDSAKMAQYTDNWNFEKDGKKKLNFLHFKRLNSLSRLRLLTGMFFAHLALLNVDSAVFVSLLR